jgi:hypothetical protein
VRKVPVDVESLLHTEELENRVMWWSLSAGALLMAALLARRYLLRRPPRPFSAGSVSESWLAEQKSKKSGWSS